MLEVVKTPVTLYQRMENGTVKEKHLRTPDSVALNCLLRYRKVSTEDLAEVLSEYTNASKMEIYIRKRISAIRDAFCAIGFGNGTKSDPIPGLTNYGYELSYDAMEFLKTDNSEAIENALAPVSGHRKPADESTPLVCEPIRNYLQSLVEPKVSEEGDVRFFNRVVGLPRDPAFVTNVRESAPIKDFFKFRDTLNFAEREESDALLNAFSLFPGFTLCKEQILWERYGSLGELCRLNVIQKCRNGGFSLQEEIRWILEITGVLKERFAEAYFPAMRIALTEAGKAESPEINAFRLERFDFTGSNSVKEELQKTASFENS